MFTGIVEEVGRIRDVRRRDGAVTLDVDAATVTVGAVVGASLALDGVCLTVTEVLRDAAGVADGFRTDVMGETLDVTTVGDLRPGDRVNLERALAAGGRLDGHIVQGHVDGIGEVVDVDDRPGTRYLTVTVPGRLAHYLVGKGSVTVAGVSLTVVDTSDGTGDGGPATFRVALIPHTLAVTTLGTLGAGARVNLETDVIARYVERLLPPRDAVRSVRTAGRSR